MEAIEAIEEIPIKEKKPRSAKQIEAFAKALAKKAELKEINKQFNDAKQKQKNGVVEHKKRIIKSVKEEEEEEVEVEIKKPTKKKVVKPKVIEESSESEEEEVIVKRKKKKKPINKLSIKIHLQNQKMMMKQL
jgi:hypothetical protein